MIIEELKKIAVQAGRAIMEIYTSVDAQTVITKDDNSPLTLADIASHKTILEGLQPLTSYPIISEEAELPDYESRRQWTHFWLVDPLDGTKEFIKRNGEFTVNIALIANGEPVIGVIYLPAKDILYFAEKGKGSFKQLGNDEPVRIFSSQKEKPEVAIVSRSHANQALLDWLAEKGITKSIDAGSSLKFCFVAEGLADVYPRTGPTMEWDVAAGDCIWRNACEDGQQNRSEITYNKPDLRNTEFVIGLV